MRKGIFVTGLVILILGILLSFLAGAILPGNFTIPLVYGSNQILWLFVAAVGFIAAVVGLFLKSRK